jgi:hypothetical protein
LAIIIDVLLNTGLDVASRSVVSIWRVRCSSGDRFLNLTNALRITASPVNARNVVASPVTLRTLAAPAAAETLDMKTGGILACLTGDVDRPPTCRKCINLPPIIRLIIAVVLLIMNWRLALTAWRSSQRHAGEFHLRRRAHLPRRPQGRGTD